MQDLVHTVLFTGIDPEAKTQKMRTMLREAHRLEDSFRKQSFNLFNNEVDQIMRELQVLNAVAPCQKCNSTGRLQQLDGPPKKCPVCRGTGWEMLL